MFGIGMPEMILILAIALIVIGPKKLPDLARSLGRAMREFRKATNEFKESIQIDQELSDVKKAFNKVNDGSQRTDQPAGETKPLSEDKEDQSTTKSEKPRGSDNMPELKQAFDKWNAESSSSGTAGPNQEVGRPSDPLPDDEAQSADTKGSGKDDS